MTTDFLKTQMNRMRVNWRLTLDNPSKVLQDGEFQPLLEKWGPEKFKATVDSCIQKHSTGFFPTVGEFMAYETSVSKGWGTCERCKPDGYVIVKRYNAEFGRIEERARRCDHNPVGGL